MSLKKIIRSLILCILPISSYADHCGGKVDVGPVYVHLNVLESGRTVKRLDMAGAKINGTIMLKEGYGFCVKPDIMFATGHGELIVGAVGFGHVTPVFKDFCVTPTIGVALTNLRTSVDVPTGAPEPYPQSLHLRERFRSLSPYVGLDFNYNICQGLRICANVQYSWSRTHTRIEKAGKFKGNSKGPSYALMLEKDVSKEWSVHLGAAYNTGLSHEKHGLRGYGIKLGAARWF